MIKLIIFDVDGTIAEMYTLRLLPGVADFFRLALGGDCTQMLKVALATNQGGVGMRYVLEQGGSKRASKYPTQAEIEQRLHDLVSALLGSSEARIPTYTAFRYLEKSGTWTPAPPGMEEDPRWSVEWRKPFPGMLLQAMRDAEAAPDTTLFIGDSPDDENAARAAGCAFRHAGAFFAREWHDCQSLIDLLENGSLTMEQNIRVVGLGGSLMAGSTSLSALRIALEGAQTAGAEIELFDIREMDLPFYQRGIPVPEAADRLMEVVCQAQGMLWSSPLYHGTISGAFKNAIDWLDLLRDQDPPFLTDTIVGLVSTAGGMQGLQAINTMEFSVRALRAWAVPLVMPVSQAWKAFNEDGIASDPAIDRQLRFVGSEVVRAARQFATDGACDYSVAGRLLGDKD